MRFLEGSHLFVELRDMLLDARAYPVIHAASMQAVALLLEHVLEILATRQEKTQGVHLRGQQLPEPWTPFLARASQQTSIQRSSLAAYVDTVTRVD